MKRSWRIAVVAAALALAPAMLHAQTYPITASSPFFAPVVGPQFVVALTGTPLPSPTTTQACFYVSDEAATTGTALNIQTGAGAYAGSVTFTVPASYLAGIAPVDISASGFVTASVYFVPTGSTCTGMANAAYSSTVNIFIQVPTFSSASTNNLPQTNTALTTSTPLLFTITGRYFAPSTIVQFTGLPAGTVTATTKYLSSTALLVTAPTIPSNANFAELQVVTVGPQGSYLSNSLGDLSFYAVRQSILGTPAVTANPAGAGATLTFSVVSQDAGQDSMQLGGVPTGAITMTETNSSNATVGSTVTGALTTNPLSTSFTAFSGFTDDNTGDFLYTAIADFNGDGVPDVLVVDSSDSVSVLTTYPGAYPLGDFGQSVSTEMPTFCTAYAVTPGDINGDGILDLAVLCGDNVTSMIDYVIMLGNGDGTFTYSNTVDSGMANGLALGDFYHHGKLDLAAIGTDSTESFTQVNLYPGNGDGTFGATTITSLNNPNLGFPVLPISTVDIDGDGYPDLVLNVSSDLAVLVSNGDGTVGNASAGTPNFIYSAGAGATIYYAATGDVNNDNKIDILLTGDLSGEVRPRQDVRSRAKARAAAERRGIPLPVAGEKSSATSPPLAVPSQRPQGAATGPHAAVKPNAVKPKLVGPNIVALLNTSTPGAVSFATPVTTSLPMVANAPIAVANFDGDCCNDVLISDGSNLNVYSGNNTGAFAASDTNLTTPLPGGSEGLSAVAGVDLNGDGAADIVYSAEIPGSPTPEYSVGEALTTGTASASTVGNPALPPGTYTVNYTYNGNSLIYTGSTTSLNPLTITTEATTTGVVASQPSVVFGQSETLTATIAQGVTTSDPPTGTVTFVQGTTNVLGTVTLSGGQAVLGGVQLGAGMYTVTATYSGDTYNASSSGMVSFTVTQVTPTITWAAPSAISYGTALSATQLDATASTAGTFVYTPASGTVLTAGTQTLSVTFTPTDTTDYTTANKSVSITVNQATPTITWAAPSAISYGTALSATQLDATASTAGTFAYTPASGAVLTAGTQTLSVTFTPTDTTDYTTANKTVSLTVNQAMPTITWAAPSAISYGAALSATQLDATASTAGTFVYTPASGTVLTAGTQTLSVTFTPTDTTDYTTANKSVSITVNQATPTITWAAPSAISYGTALSATQLDATSGGVAGTFAYTPPAGTVLAAGTQTLSVTFTPTDTTDYTTATKTVSITVNQVTPTLTWTAPSAISYGTALSATQLDATSGGVAGTFVYTPPAGTVLAAGTQTLSVTFTPTDTTDYTTATKTVSLTVNQVTPTITWAAPSAISYGTALSATQLDATSGGVAGTFVYTPPAGTVLAAGTQTLSVTFTPTDTTDYTTATKTVSITVNQVTPTITWAAPSAISYGTALSATQLDATSGGVAGTFVYTPPAGTVLAAGTQTLSVTFTPTDTTDYTTATKTVSLTVNQVTPTITWAAPSAISYGTALSATQLDATSGGVAGTFAYTPPAGTVLAAGTQTLSVTFTPTDTTDYTTATKTVSLTVNQVTPTLTWAAPSAISYGTALSATQLDATSGGVAGTFAYTPPAGTVLAAGTQTLSVTFTPTDTTDYTTATKTVSLTVNQVTPTLTWAAPSAISYGTALSATQLDATSGGVAGTFAYTPASGTVLAAGAQTLSVTFTPTDTTDYTTATKTVSITVNQVTPTITWAAPSAISYGTALSATQLDATSGGVAGTFAYTPPAGTVLAAGTQTLSVTFTPTDTTDYTTATKTVSITVNQVTPTLTWAAPSAISYGTALSATQLDAISGGVAGTFVYTPPAGTVLAAGTQTLSVTFTPTDTTDYTTATKTVSLTVNQVTPTITWAAPSAISYGTALSATQLDATSGGVAGMFVYTPASGTVLAAGAQTLSVTFTPTDTTDYATATKTVSLTVSQASPTLTWTAPSAIVYGTALSATQLDATAAGISGTLAGTLVYTPPAGTVLAAGTQTLSVTFTPTDTTDYSTATKTVSITVTQVTPALTWAAPSAISYGTALSATQLDATATGVSGTLAGTFVYTPASGTVLTAGIHTLSVTFTPTDTTDYATATKTVLITVGQSAPALIWSTPSAISYGTALSATQLNATAAGVSGTLAGTFAYTPASGTVLATGTQTLSVTFTPTDTTDYTTAAKTVSITVNQSTLTVTAHNLAIEQGQAIPALTYAITGFQNGDTQASATTGAPSLSTTATSSSPGGTYPITPVLNTLAASNYTFSFVNGTLTVTAFSIGSLSSDSIAAGSGSATITLAGSGFSANDVVTVNGTAISTTYNSPTSLTATIPASYLTTSNTTLPIAVKDNSTGVSTASTPFVVGPSVLGVTTSILPNVPVNTAYSATLTASGGVGPYTWSIISGSLPTGLTLDTSTGAITGTPTIIGTPSFTVQSTDSEATPMTATTTLAIGVNQAQSLAYDFCLKNTTCPDGNGPTELIQADDGNFYGVTEAGGVNTDGVLFQLTPGGVETVLYNFCSVGADACTDGSTPVSLVLGGDGNFYGVTVEGGANQAGSIFQLTPAGVLTTLYSFCVGSSTCPDGMNPESQLTPAGNGIYFGTTPRGGANGYGAVFEVNTAGTFKTLYSFTGGTDGGTPNGLVQASDGNFYGMAQSGGNINSACMLASCGTIFRVDSKGNLTTIYSFCPPASTGCADGYFPVGVLNEGPDGNLYGATEYGGSNSVGAIFNITTAGTLTTLYSFCTGGGTTLCNSESGNPQNGLYLGSDGNFYGASGSGGNTLNSNGAAFQITPAGSLTTIYNFCSLTTCNDGSYPATPPVLASDGNFYGTTSQGGSTNGPDNVGGGVIYKLTGSALQAPVQMTLSSTSAAYESPVTLSWQVLNAFSATAQQCYAYVLSGGAAAGNWTGLQSGTLTAGVYSGSASITPTAAGTYTYGLTCGGVESAAPVTLTVSQATPTLTWAAPSAIPYGTALSATQLDASATGVSGTLAGTFVYTPAAGTVLTAGTQTLSVTFTPTDTTDYTTASKTVSLTVSQATPGITWSNPAAILYGTALSATQLDAAASGVSGTLAGTFVYTPAAGTVLTAGTQTLSVTFTPTDTTDYTTASKTVSLNVSQATPGITWSNPAAITYGTALSATQLDAAASGVSGTLAGTFVYTPAAGTVLTAGTQTLSVTFTPTDTTDYTAATKTATLVVNQATLTVTANSLSIQQGQAVPTLTYAITGFQNGDMQATATSGAPTLATTATQSSPPNTYPITVAQGTLAATNYTFAFVPGTLTITPFSVSSLSPNSAPSGSPNTPITVTGQGFSATDNILVNGSPLATTYNSATSLSATIPAEDLATMSTLQIAVMDNSTNVTTASAPFTVGPAVVAVTTTALPSVTVNTAYPATTLTATGGVAPYTWSITSGSPPNGLSLAPSTGVISGNPTAVGVAAFTVQVADSETTPMTATASLTIAVNAVESVVHSFCSLSSCADGDQPTSGLVQGNDGNYYGATDFGGANNDGTVFQVTPSGTLTTLYSFCNQANCTDGKEPESALVQGSDGNLYGTTTFGGNSNSGGTIFKLTPAGALTTLYSFCTQASCTDGETPTSGLVQGNDGNFYGTTNAGGAKNDGTVFQITPAGALTTLYSFCSLTSCTDGGTPQAGLVQGSDGNFYGTTSGGGANNKGTAFQITPSGALTTLYSFCSLANCTDGYTPAAGVVEGTDGNYYGTTYEGGNSSNPNGTVFKLTPSGTLTTLYSFCNLANCVDGINPHAGLVQGSDGNFYGATNNGGASSNDGTIFQITPSGNFTTLYSFCSVTNCTDASYPQASLVQGSDGNFYSTAETGGAGVAASGAGAIYKVSASPALAAPVQLTLSSGSAALGTPVTLSWQVLNAASTTLQQCYAFVLSGGAAAGNWTGLETGTLTAGVYSGSASITPTATGTYAYGFTCGGMESAAPVSLTVTSAGLISTTTALASSSNSPVYGAPISLTATITPSNPSGPASTANVTFYDGATPLGTVANSGFTAVLTGVELGAGTHSLSAVYAGDSNYQTSTGTESLTVAPAVLNVTANNLSKPLGAANPTLTYTITGFQYSDMQAGATTGAPTLSTTATTTSPAGMYPITITQGTLAAANYTFSFVNGTLTVAGNGLTVTTASLPIGKVGVAYSTTLTATGGITPYTWSITVGALPAGLSLNSSTGTISGTPTAPGVQTFTVQVADSESPPAIQAVPISLAVDSTENIIGPLCAQTGCPDGSDPRNAVIEASDGNLYGAAYQGGSAKDGAIFKISPKGALSLLYTFCTQTNCPDGEFPQGLVEGPDGTLYGTTFGVSSVGGGSNFGTVFRITTAGSLTTLYSFCSQSNCADGQGPGNLTVGSDGNLYGATSLGGANGNGSLFKITPAGAFTQLYSFCATAGCPDGSQPSAGLMQASDGNFYGVTNFGGTQNSGLLYKLTPAGAVTPLYSFCQLNDCADGSAPDSLLVQGANGDLYGATSTGGAADDGALFDIALNGTLTLLDSFTGANGNSPNDLVLGSDGNFYGTSQSLGEGNGGTFFELTPAGAQTTLYTFCSQANCADGGTPEGLLQGSDGQFYGTASTGAANSGGAIVQLPITPALPAPVQLALSSSSTTVGTPVRLTFNVLNAFSTTLQQCYAFVQNAATGAGNWTGLQTGALTSGVFTGAASITPTAPGAYTYALTCGGVESGFSGVLTVTPAKGQLTLTSITPNTSNIGASDTTITLTGTGFIATDQAQVNGTSITTNFVSATTLTAVIPAADLAVPAVLEISVYDPTAAASTQSLPLTVSAPPVSITFSGPSTATSASQPDLAFALTNPYPVELTATLTLTFEGAGGVDDPNVEFANGSRTFSFNIAANTTTTPTIALQTGTDAGNITIALGITLTSNGQDVTPNVNPVVINIPTEAPAITSMTLTRNGDTITANITGYSNTRDMTQAAFVFTGVLDSTVGDPDITVPETALFGGWYGSAPSDAFGSEFLYTQAFTLNDDNSNIGQVTVTLTNSAGTSSSAAAQ